VFAGLAVTYIDVHGRTLKYYWFRIASVGAFTYYLLLFLFIKNKIKQRFSDTRIVQSICIFAMSIFAVINIGKNFSRNIFPPENKDLTELVNYVNERTKPDDVYLFKDKDELEFPRRTRREALVIFKFDPGGGEKIYEWYKRETLRERLREDISVIDTISATYRLDYLITEEPVEYRNLKEVYHNKKYHLYEVVKSE